ncbi:MAG: RNA-binding protein [Zetaproteobacteria bacterium]|nr:RNA-binding protein [Zetaproteobacteria bacterium]
MSISCFFKLCGVALVCSLLGYAIQPSLLASSPAPSLFATGLFLGTLLGGLIVTMKPLKKSMSSISSNSQVNDSNAQQLDGHVLYVGNVPFNAKEDEIQRLFEAYGQVKAIRMVTGGPNKRPKGYGFVEMDKAGAQAALALNGKEFAGRKLRVNSAKNKES